MHVLSLPAGTAVRQHILPKPLAAGFHHTLIIAVPPREATPDAFASLLIEPGGFAALLTHDRGVAWTDRAGEKLLAATLERGGIAVMAFAALADAMAAANKVRRLVGPGGDA